MEYLIDMNRYIAQAVELLGSQSALARACGLSQASINRLLKGTRRPSAETAVAIERATAGTITREQLRPDLYIRSAADATPAP